ncbi:MAG: sensor histidine kinase [Nocardioidaceae bacterium]
METARSWRPTLPDVALAVGLAGFALVVALVAPDGTRDLDPLAFALLVTSALVLVFRRRMPMAVLIASIACVYAYQLRGYPDVPPIPILVGIYTAVRAGRRGLTIVVAGIGLIIVTFAVNHSRLPDESTRDVIQGSMLIAGWLVAAGVIAEVVRHRQAYIEGLKQRAVEAERTREEAALRRAGEERLRIARELHDSLTHSISIIKIQAGVAVHLARKRGESVPDALIAIQETSAEAVRELRATIDVLRADPETPSNGNGLDQLAELVERTRLAGLDVSVEVTGTRRELPPEVDRAAYRIVQESLTNVTRHAGSATAAVTVDYRDRGLTVQIDDDGIALPDDPPVPGVGLIGMRERVAALGGTLCAEPRTTGGFRVRAELPTSKVPAQ